MRVCLVTETYFPQVNGVSRTLGELTRVLTESGDTVQIIHPQYNSPPVHEQTIAVRSFNPPFYRELFLPLPPFTTVRKGINSFQPDLVHIATEGSLGVAVLRYCRRRKIPVVSSFHTNFDQYSDHYRLGLFSPIVWRYLRWFHNATRQTYVPSHATIQELEDRGFQRLVLWPRGVDSKLFRPDRPGRESVRDSLGFAPDQIVVGHVSRIAAEKNVAYLAKALSGLVSRHGDRVRLLIVGDGPARPELEQILGVSAKFVGYRTGEDLADHYSACDLFAFASLTETFGNVILEAMASGLPVVAIRKGGPGDLVQDGLTGSLVAPTAPPSVMTDQLAALVEDRKLRELMAIQARRFAVSQSWDTIMTGLRNHYLACLGFQNNQVSAGCQVEARSA